MNWKAIKHIYRSVLIERAKIKYIGKNRYIITRFHSSGEKWMETEHKNRSVHGKSICWYKNRIKNWEKEYKNDLEHGKSICWYENGIKQWEIGYKNGLLHGKNLHWYENGLKNWEEKYKNGVLINK